MRWLFVFRLLFIISSYVDQIVATTHEGLIRFLLDQGHTLDEIVLWGREAAFRNPNPIPTGGYVRDEVVQKGATVFYYLETQGFSHDDVQNFGSSVWDRYNRIEPNDAPGRGTAFLSPPMHKPDPSVTPDDLDFGQMDISTYPESYKLPTYPEYKLPDSQMSKNIIGGKSDGRLKTYKRTVFGMVPDYPDSDQMDTT